MIKASFTTSNKCFAKKGGSRTISFQCKATNDSSEFRNKYRDEIKNLVKRLQNRKIDQVQEIQATQTKIFDDFKDFHVATLKIFQDEIQDRIVKLEKKDSDVTKSVEVIDGVELNMNEDLSRTDSG